MLIFKNIQNRVKLSLRKQFTQLKNQSARSKLNSSAEMESMDKYLFNSRHQTLMLLEIKIISVNMIYCFILRFGYFFIYFKISIAKNGTLEFKHGERSKTLPITIIDGILVFYNSILKIFAKIYFFQIKLLKKTKASQLNYLNQKAALNWVV